MVRQVYIVQKMSPRDMINHKRTLRVSFFFNHPLLKLIFFRPESGHEFKCFPAKKCLWLADLLYGLPISVLFFCRETIWTLVLNQFSERLSLVFCQSKVRLHLLWSKITHDHFTILWSRITHDHFVKILKLAIMIHDSLTYEKISENMF